MLRPPHYSQELLASAQVRWLGGASFPGPSAAESQWASLGKSGNAGALEKAVAAANAGELVIAGYPAPGNTPGHVAVVRPQDVPHDNAAGPVVIMAGEVNARSIAMREAFKNHPGAWPANIQLFAHDTVLEKDVEASVGTAA